MISESEENRLRQRNAAHCFYFARHGHSIMAKTLFHSQKCSKPSTFQRKQRFLMSILICSLKFAQTDKSRCRRDREKPKYSACFFTPFCRRLFIVFIKWYICVFIHQHHFSHSINTFHLCVCLETRNQLKVWKSINQFVI